MLKKVMCLFLVAFMIIEILPLPARAENDTAEENVLDAVVQQTEQYWGEATQKTSETVVEEDSQDTALTEAVESTQISEEAEAAENIQKSPETEMAETTKEAAEDQLEATDEIIDQGTCGNHLTWMLTKDGTLCIRGNGDMDNFGSYSSDVQAPWLSHRQTINTVVIENGVTGIGDSAFDNCGNLTNVVIPDGITYIGLGAFLGCYSLALVFIPESVTSIGTSAFQNCESLVRVQIPDSVTSIGRYAFAECYNLKNLQISNQLTCIDEGVFSECRSLVSVTIPNRVTSIGTDAFWRCTGLTSVIIPDSVTSIGKNAFSLCSGLKDVYYIGSSDDWAKIAISSGNDSLKNATLHTPNPSAVFDQGKCGKNLTWILTGDGTLRISGSGNMDDYIDQTPWVNHKDMITNIIVENGVSGIGDCAFWGCSNLTSVTIPDSVTSLGAYVFSRCSSLPSITIPGGVTVISAYTFLNCTSLITVSIPGDVTSIGGAAFQGCTELKDIYYANTREQWQKITIGKDNESLLAATIHCNEPVVLDEITSIHLLAFSELAYIDWSVGETIKDHFVSRDMWFSDCYKEIPQMKNADLYHDIANWNVVFTPGSAKDVKFSTGFYAVAFQGQTASGLETVIAYRGTSVNSADDWLDDVLNDVQFQVSDIYANQLSDALDFYSNCMKSDDIRGSKITTTGHSLGGALASMVSMVYNVRSELFNTAYAYKALYSKRPALAAREFRGVDAWNMMAHHVLGDPISGYLYEYNDYHTILYPRAHAVDIANHDLYNFLVYDADSQKVSMKSPEGTTQCTSALSFAEIDLFLGTSHDDDFIHKNLFPLPEISFPLPVIMKNYVLYGGDGDDILTIVGNSSDTFIGGKGDDFLDGGKGDDTYYIYKGDGVTTIRDGGGEDNIILMDFLPSDQLTFTHHETVTQLYCNGSLILTIHSFRMKDQPIRVFNNDSLLATLQDGWLWGAGVSFQVACPTDVDIIDSNGKVVLTLENGIDTTTYTDFGNFYVFASDDGESVKYADMLADYTFRIRGVGDGTMTVSYCTDEGKEYVISDVPVTAGMTAEIINGNVPILAVDENSDGTADNLLPMTDASPVIGEGSCGEDTTWKLTEDGILTISGTGSTSHFDSGTAPWYEYREVIREVVIGPTVSGIGDSAFYDCSNLTSVVIPDNVTSISDWIFEKCTSLTYVVLPNNIQHMGAGVFMHCSNLVSVTLPSNLTTIHNYFFYGCNNLTSVVIPGSVTSIDKYAFAGCNNLKDVYYGSSLERWKKITIETGNSVLTNAIRHYVVARGTCGESLTWVLTGDDTLRISGIGKMKDFISTTVPWRDDKAAIRKVIIEPGVTSIGEFAFYEFSSLESVAIPDSVTRIGRWAFRYSSVSSVVIPNGVSCIEEYTFGGCSKLTDVKIPNSVTSIGSSAFYGCSSLSVITIPSSVTAIGDSAFNQCSSVSSVVIPNGVSCIEEYTFGGCSKLTDVKIPNSVTSIGSSAFYGCSSLSVITIPSSVTAIGDSAFNRCSSLTVVVIPDSVTDLGEHAFFLCTNLKNVTLPGNITSIKEGAFRDCGNLTSVTIPERVTDIGSHSFQNCTGLTSISIPGSVTHIGEYAFYNCSRLMTIYYDSVQHDWEKISIEPYNNQLKRANIHYSSDAPIVSFVKGPNGESLYHENGNPVPTKYGYVDYNGSKFLVANGKIVTTKSGLAKDPEHPEDWYFLSHGQVQTQHTGLTQYDGEWFYVENGKLDTTLSAVVEYDGGLFLVARGRLLRDKNGLGQDPVTHVWYYFSHGQVQTQFTGLAQYDSKWFYVQKGVFDSSYSGEITYKNRRYLIKNGTMVRQIG